MSVIKDTQAVGLSPQERNLLFLLVRGRTAAQDPGLATEEAERTLRRLQGRCGTSAHRALIARAMILCWV